MAINNGCIRWVSGQMLVANTRRHSRLSMLIYFQLSSFCVVFDNHFAFVEQVAF